MASGGVLCSGNIVYDTVVRPVEELPWGATAFVDTVEYHIGGNGANTSLVLGLLGVPVRLLAGIGSDHQGRFVLEKLERAGVDTSRVTVLDAPTAASIVIVNRAGDRGFLHRLGASAAAFADPIAFTPEVIAGMSHYHYASPFGLPRLRPRAAATLEAAHAAGLTTSLDTNWDSEGRWMRDLGPCMPHLDIIFMNEDEARMTTGSADPRAAARCLLDAGAGTAVIKLGARGCAIYSNGAEIVCPGFAVDAIDTTGAGDCFVAGYLAALHRGEPPAAAGRFANAVAALSVRQIGAVSGVPDSAGVVEWMRTARHN
jgi:sugar/nucleoside kinase (ribokinase family)